MPDGPPRDDNRRKLNMTRVAATLERRLRVAACPEVAYAFFSRPEQFSQAMEGVEQCERLPDGGVRWVLEEKVDQGIRFRPDYVVMYDGDGARVVRWQSIAGNMENAGEVVIRPTADGGSEIHYCERVGPDLPISPLMAKLIQSLVARELRNEIDRFLNRAHERLDRPIDSTTSYGA